MIVSFAANIAFPRRSMSAHFLSLAFTASGFNVASTIVSFFELA
jgi:hypothetical protein